MFVVGFATRDEISQLEQDGYDVEDAAKFGRVVGSVHDSLMRAPDEGPSETRAVAVFVDTAVYDVLTSELAPEHVDSPPIGKLECHKPDEAQGWPELPLDEEFLRIVLLQARVMGKDITVEPYKSWNNELAWRRTDKYMVGSTEKTMNVEQVYDLQATITRLSQAFSNQEVDMARRVRNHLCSHKRADGSDYTVGVPVSAERWCDACKAQFD